MLRKVCHWYAERLEFFFAVGWFSAVIVWGHEIGWEGFAFGVFWAICHVKKVGIK